MTTQARNLSPGQRTATTARLIVIAGISGCASAVAFGSVAASLFMAFLILAGAVLLSAARAAD